MFVSAVTLIYCNPATAPTLPHAGSTPLTTIFATTYFTCNVSGYQTNGASQPYYTCEPDTYLAGRWTPVSYSCEKIGDYCNASTAPLLANAVSNTPQTTVDSVTYFTCDMGYVSSGGAAAPPFFTCTAAGEYSAITNACICMPFRPVLPHLPSETVFKESDHWVFQMLEETS